MGRSNPPGIQYLVVDSAHTLFEYDGGLADLHGHRPMDPATTMMAYSMSKTITAVAVLQLVAAGRVSLDSPIAQYLDSLPYPPTITVRLLLAHTSGIPNPIPLRWVHPAAQHATFDETAALARELQAHPHLASDPGTQYGYSNIGYWLLGRLLERVSGEPFAAYVSTHVLRPLGVTPQELGYAIPDPGHHASGYLAKYSFLNLVKGFLIDRELVGEYAGRWLSIRSGDEQRHGFRGGPMPEPPRCGIPAVRMLGPGSGDGGMGRVRRRVPPRARTGMSGASAGPRGRLQNVVTNPRFTLDVSPSSTKL
jgi:CubicO group peptidase (beta-lactamase class C family)